MTKNLIPVICDDVRREMDKYSGGSMTLLRHQCMAESGAFKLRFHDLKSDVDRLRGLELSGFVLGEGVTMSDLSEGLAEMLLCRIHQGIRGSK